MATNGQSLYEKLLDAIKVVGFPIVMCCVFIAWEAGFEMIDWLKDVTVGNIITIVLAILGFLTTLFKINKIHVDMNSRFTEYLKLKGEAAHAEGRLEGAKDAKQESNAASAAREEKK